jgi:hypothetical protein
VKPVIPAPDVWIIPPRADMTPVNAFLAPPRDVTEPGSYVRYVDARKLTPVLGLGEDAMRDIAVVLRAFHAATCHGGCNVSRIEEVSKRVSLDRVARLADAVSDAYLEPIRRSA